MDAEAEGREAAERFRAEHRLGVQPLGDLVATIEQTTGIDVAVLDAGPDEHGLTMRDPSRNAVFIGVARTRHPMRQRSTLAHELAHVLFEDWSDSASAPWSARTPTELRADAFARNLIVPREGLRQFVSGHDASSLSTLSSIVQRFLVSPAMAAIAACQADLIDTQVKDEWRQWTTPTLAVRLGWSDHYHVLQADADQRRAPQRLLARAINGYIEGVLPVQAIATLRGVTVQEAEAELREAGVVVRESFVPWTGSAELPPPDVDLSGLDDADVSGQQQRSGG
ncbi:ImmA/IrrE family metallo-endopeptidase [Kribbella sp. NPDC026611]|uniref:ImmA/IrrE family metallo-endopeptidase n=1 Tax=Kribbella sp. NPDC026611 TaxID=3154911 RepID=UPI0033E1F8A2